MATSPVKDFLVTYVMPEKCYERIFVSFYINGPCLKFIMSRAVGLWILLDTFLAQLLQLLTILWRGSADGLSLSSVLLQLYAFSCPVVYAIANNFPLFAWGERLFALAQTAAIVFLILHYRGETLKAAAAVSVMHTSSLAALIASKVLQAGTNYRNGHTGQLSTLSVLLSWAASLGVIFVSLQETESLFATLSHTVSACLSGILLIQVLCYRRNTATSRKKNE
ncbi:mannose-P-dolichol utilization defect 1 protein isoform X2 [Etheostoma spectabile]|uniref:mannose-P-dolichol utilization defect 1 protein isoform X2 n=1 Tax=Etheostoma spectabile TaxID=54343 RepID=UPI0013AF031E|nr:mannose-P-dolichol utilization defect 1 protein-like isoform X2 [Etheostoma spectabile]